MSTKKAVSQAAAVKEVPSPARLTLEWILANRKTLPSGKRLNASTLSEAAGLRRSHVSTNIKNNVKDMKRPTAEALAREGQVPVEWFYSGPPASPETPIVDTLGDWPAFDEAAAKAEGAGISPAAIKSVRVGRGKLQEAETAETLYNAMIQAEREIRRGKKLIEKPLDE